MPHRFDASPASTSQENTRNNEEFGEELSSPCWFKDNASVEVRLSCSLHSRFLVGARHRRASKIQNSFVLRRDLLASVLRLVLASRGRKY